MPKLFRSLWALAALALVALAGDAVAGDAIRLLLEPPPGVASVEPGQSIDVQIVGQDSDGKRVGFGSYVVETSATEGDFQLVEAPFRWRYTAPAAPASRSVQLSASFRRRPDVAGSLTLSIARRRETPPAPPAGNREPVRLSVELPQGVTSLEPGRTIDVQVTPLDASGARVALAADRRIETSATAGDVAPIDASQRFRYTAPAALDARGGAASVQIRAWIKQRPDVQGMATLAIVAARPYDRLTLRGPGAMDAGESAEVEVLGSREGGAPTRVRDQRLTVALDGPGALENLSPGLYRYTAPRDEVRGDRRAARITASLERWPDMTVELSIETRRGGPGGGRSDVARLAFEAPRGATSVEAGQTIEVRLLAFDAAGARVALGDGRVETSASVGDLALVEAPERYRYTAPAVVDRTPSVELRAALLRRGPEVRATTTLQLTPRRPYERLVVRGATSVELGRATDLDVLAVRADGVALALRDQRVVAALDGPGTLETVSPGVFRYSAAPVFDLRAGLRVARVVVSLERWPTVQGELSIVLTPDAHATTPYGRIELRGPAVMQLGTSADIAAYFTQKDGTMAPAGQRVVVALTGPGAVASTGLGTFRYTAPPAGDVRSDGRTARLVASFERDPGVAGELVIQLSADPPSDADATGVLWPSGNVRLVLWRAKETRDADWPTQTQPLPAPGRPLVSPGGFVRLRIQPERDDVRKIELEWYVADKAGAVVRVDDADPAGRLRLVKGTNGRTHAVVETEVPETGRPLVLVLLLTTAKGEIVREEFVVERSRPSRR